MNTCSARTPDGAEKVQNRLLTCAAHNRDCVSAGVYRTATVRESAHKAFFSTVTPACSVHTRVNDFCVETIAECAT
jgi:hypothetical protein